MIVKQEPVARPTASQLEWADAEIGVIIHFDLQVFEPDYEFREKWGYSPDLNIFTPENLDTDQWISAAKSAGAKYAVLVAKHCSGFSLWPTKAHDYHVGNTPWKNGQGDIVGDFFKSCAKYGLKPGIYCSASCNGHLLVDNPGKVLTDDPEFLKKYSASRELQSGKGSIWAPEEKQLEYNNIVETQLTELWTNYGKLFEIWFDGGVLQPEKGGPSIIPLMEKFQPDALVFGGPPGWPSLVRFVGNERAEPDDPFWSATDDLSAFDGTTEVCGLGGNPDGAVWAPGEADMPNRDQHLAKQGGWFWREDDDQHLYSVDHLVECYMRSVGKNTNLLLGMVIDNRGMVPEADQQQFAEFGEKIKKIFSNQVPATPDSSDDLNLNVTDKQPVNMVVLQENVEHGDRVRKYVVEAKVDGEWLTIARGSCIGHKRIERFDAVAASAVRLRILECAGLPHIRNISLWNADPELFSVPMNPVLRDAPTIVRDKNDLINIRCVNPNLLVKYTTDGSEPDENSPVFDKPFVLHGEGVVKACSFINELSYSKVVTACFGMDRSKWTVECVSLESPFSNNGFAGSEHLLNDDPDYYWHTYHTNKEKSAPPHEVLIDMHEEIKVKAFTLTLGSESGSPETGVFYLSGDGKEWTEAAQINVSNTDSFPCQKTVYLQAPICGRFIRFVAERAINNDDYIKISGIGVIAAG